MNCPVCQEKLTREIINTIEIDLCKRGCGGLWFDRFEIKKFDEPHEINISTQIKKTKDHFKKSHERSCPKCEGVVLMTRFSSIKQKVEINECANCAGIWLDGGELSQIRNEFQTEQDRILAAEKFAEETFTELLKQTPKIPPAHNKKSLKNLFYSLFSTKN